MDKKVWYFTFCYGDPIHGGWCQPIKAASYGEARRKMFEMYGEKWAFQYSEEEWLQAKNDPRRMWSMEKEYELVEVEL
jgi:hypothetical protein